MHLDSGGPRFGVRRRAACGLAMLAGEVTDERAKVDCDLCRKRMGERAMREKRFRLLRLAAHGVATAAAALMAFPALAACPEQLESFEIAKLEAGAKLCVRALADLAPPVAVEVAWRDEHGRAETTRYVPTGATSFPDGFTLAIDSPAAMRDGGTAELRAFDADGRSTPPASVAVKYPMASCVPIEFGMHRSTYYRKRMDPGELIVRATVECPAS